LTVDSVYGNDDEASISPSTTSFQNINGAISYRLLAPANPQQTIFVYPGTYYESIVIPTNTAIRGSSTQTTFISLTGPTGPTTLVTMGEQTRLEDITLNLSYTGTYHHDLVGIEFPGTTSQTAKLRTSVVTVDNRNADALAETSNVTGVLFSGTGSVNPSSFSFNSIKGSTINVYSNGAGNKRGILVSGSNQVSTRDTNIYVAAPQGPAGPIGSYVGVETNDVGGTGSIQLRSTTIGAPRETAPLGTYTSSDILQTTPASLTNPTYLASPGIQIGPGTDLVTKSAGTKPFSTYTYPTTLFYCGYGNIQNHLTGYLWPGTVKFENNRYPDQTNPAARYRIQQPTILSGISASCNILNSGHSVQITVCKNATGGSVASNPTVFTVTLTSTALSGSFYDGSVDFAAGDFINVFISVNGGSLHDLAIQLDLF
jgi:hypothetical protein